MLLPIVIVMGNADGVKLPAPSLTITFIMEQLPIQPHSQL